MERDEKSMRACLRPIGALLSLFFEYQLNLNHITRRANLMLCVRLVIWPISFSEKTNLPNVWQADKLEEVKL